MVTTFRPVGPSCTMCDTMKPWTKLQFTPYVQDLSEELGEGLRSRYSDLGDAPFWAVLIGYDGGRKMVFRTDVE